MSPMICALCRRSADGLYNRVGGVDLCNSCHDGGAVAAACARGFAMEVECATLGSGKSEVQVAQGRASMPAPLFNASFRRKGLASLAGLLGMTIRVQDPLFHQLGVILTRDRARTQRFIDGEGAQSAVLDLLGESVNISVRSNGQVKLAGRSRHEPFDPTAIELKFAVLLVHLEAYSQS